MALNADIFNINKKKEEKITAQMEAYIDVQLEIHKEEYLKVISNGKKIKIGLGKFCGEYNDRIGKELKRKYEEAKWKVRIDYNMVSDLLSERTLYIYLNP